MFRNILQSLFTKGFVAIINFFLLIISARYLGASSRGEISILVLNITIIQIINEVYTGYSLIYFIPKYDLKKIFITGIGYTFLATSFGNSIFSILHRQLPGNEWLSYLISLIVILNTFNCVIILGKEKITLYNFLSFLQPGLLLLGLIFSIFVLHNYTIEAYLWPMLISFFISFLISFAAAIKLIGVSVKTNLCEHRSIFIYGFICQMGVLMYILCNRYSYYLLPDNAKVGLYALSSSLIESVLIISNGISPVLLARVANQGNTEKSAEMTQTLSKASVLFSFLAIVIIFLLPESFFVYILGDGFVGTKNLMLLYAPGILMISFFGIISNYFSAIGKLKLVLVCNSFGFIATLILAPYFVNKYGIEGAAYSANISYLIIAIAIYFGFFITNKLTLKRVLSFKQDYKNLKELVSSKAD